MFKQISKFTAAVAVLFLLLNIFVAVTEPIFLMIVHRSDEGMPGTTIPPVEF